MFMKLEGLLVSLNKANVLHQSMQPQNCNFNVYIYILYYQSSINFQYSPNLHVASFPDIFNQL